MANLTIVIEDEVLKRARIRAIERGESVNSYLGEMLRAYAGMGSGQGGTTQQQVGERLGQIAARSKSGSGGREWTREDAYDHPTRHRWGQGESAGERHAG